MIIDTILIRDMRSGTEWYESRADYQANPIQGTIVVKEKPKYPEPVIRPGVYVCIPIEKPKEPVYRYASPWK